MLESDHEKHRTLAAYLRHSILLIICPLTANFLKMSVGCTPGRDNGSRSRKDLDLVEMLYP